MANVPDVNTSIGALRLPNNNNSIYIGNSNSISIGAQRQNSLTFSFHMNEPAVTLHGDGTITFHEGYPLNELTEVFWKAVAHSNPLLGELERLKAENERLRQGLNILHSIDLPVGSHLVRVEFDGCQLRARSDSNPWKTVQINY